MSQILVCIRSYFQSRTISIHLFLYKKRLFFKNQTFKLYSPVFLHRLTHPWPKPRLLWNMELKFPRECTDAQQKLHFGISRRMHLFHTSKLSSTLAKILTWAKLFKAYLIFTFANKVNELFASAPESSSTAALQVSMVYLLSQTVNVHFAETGTCIMLPQ